MKRRILIMTMAASMIAGQMAAPISVLAKESTPSASYQMICSESFGEVPNTRIPTSWGDTIEVFFKPEDGRTENWHGCKAGDIVKPDSWFVDNIEAAKNNWTMPYTDHIVGWRSSLDGNIYTADNIPAVTEPVSYYAVFESTASGNEQNGGSNNYQPTQAPATQTPATQTPATQTPATQTPATQTPATQTPASQTPATQAPATQTPATQAPSTQTPQTPAVNAGVSRMIGVSAGSFVDLSGMEAGNADSYSYIKTSPALTNIEAIASDANGTTYAVTFNDNICRVNKIEAPDASGRIVVSKSMSVFERYRDVAVDKATGQAYLAGALGVYRLDIDNHNAVRVVDLRPELRATNSLIAGITVDTNGNIIVISMCGNVYNCTTDGQITKVASLGLADAEDIEYRNGVYYVLCGNNTEATVYTYSTSFQLLGSYKLSGNADVTPVTIGDISEVMFPGMIKRTSYGVTGTTQAPATQAPATQAPASQTPATQAPASQTPATQAPATQAPASQAPSSNIVVETEPTRLVAVTQTNVFDFKNVNQQSGDIYSALKMDTLNGMITSMTSDSAGNVYTLAKGVGTYTIGKYTPNSATGVYNYVGRCSFANLGTCSDIAFDKLSNRLYMVNEKSVYIVDFASQSAVPVADLTSNLSGNSTIAGITADYFGNMFVIATNGDLFRLDAAGQVIAMGSCGVDNVTDIEWVNGSYYVMHTSANKLQVAVYNGIFESRASIEVTGFSGQTPTALAILPDSALSYTSRVGEYKTTRGQVDIISNVTNLPNQRPGQVPSGQASASQAPATQAPATQAPTQAPATQAPTQAPATQAPATQAPATQVPGQIAESNISMVGITPSYIADMSTLSTGSMNSYSKLNTDQGMLNVYDLATDSTGNVYAVSVDGNRYSIYQLQTKPRTDVVSVTSRVTALSQCFDVTVDRATNQVYAATMTGVYTVDFSQDRPPMKMVFNLAQFLGETKSKIEGITVDDNGNVIVVAKNGEVYSCAKSGEITRVASLNISGVKDIEYKNGTYYVLHGDRTTSTINSYSTSFQLLESHALSGYGEMAPMALGQCGNALFITMEKGSPVVASN